MSDSARAPEPASHSVTRRTALRVGGRAALGAIAASTAASACAIRSGGTVPRTGAAGLVPVDVSWDRIIRRVVGLRPYRPAGFRLETIRMGDTLIVHNYGHGGGGITLSWGTAELAAREAEAGAVSGERRAAVLGCGVVGLAPARLLQLRGWAVTIYARDLPPRTTSNVGGGQWTPASVFDRDVATPAFMTQFVDASRIAYRYFQDFVGAGYGVRWIDNLGRAREDVGQQIEQPALAFLVGQVVGRWPAQSTSSGHAALTPPRTDVRPAGAAVRARQSVLGRLPGPSAHRRVCRVQIASGLDLRRDADVPRRVRE